MSAVKYESFRWRTSLALVFFVVLVVLAGLFGDPSPTWRVWGAASMIFLAGVLLGCCDDLVKHGLAEPGEAPGLRFAVVAAPLCVLLGAAFALMWSAPLDRGIVGLLGISLGIGVFGALLVRAVKANSGAHA